MSRRLEMHVAFLQFSVAVYFVATVLMLSNLKRVLAEILDKL